MTSHIITLLLLVICFQNVALAQEPGQSTPRPARAEALISKTVVFITQLVEANGRLVPDQGTGFFVAYSDPRLPSDQAFIYLVTNRHVAEAIETTSGCQRFPIKLTTVTFNLKTPDSSGNRQHVEVQPNPPGISWVFPADDGIDLAVLPFSDPENKFDMASVALSDFMRKEQIQTDFDVGDKILFAGLFAPFEGQHEIQPILRQGMLSMIPDGPIRATLCKPTDVYLADVHAIGGNSGSPVFVATRSSLGGMLSGPNGIPYCLLGVISGYAFETTNLTLEIATTLQGQVQGNSGISIIVPAYQLKALLDSAPLQESRDHYFSDHPKR